MTEREPVRTAVIGAGQWGKNWVRVLHQVPEALLCCVCDANPELQESLVQQYPTVDVVADAEELWNNDAVEAVVVSSSAPTHYPLAKAALEAGKHVMVEKPLALSSAHAQELVAMADERDLRLMVGHLLLYHPGVLELRSMVERGDLGDLYYIYSQRVNLGVIRKDENALWSLAPHDFSVLLYLIDAKPTSVCARGAAYIRPDVHDVVFVDVAFDNGTFGHMQVSWLDPHKIRKFTLVGSKQMAVFDDTESLEKLRIYDKGVEPGDYASYGESLSLRFGDIHVPQIIMTEPLRTEAEHFLNCVHTGDRPRSDGASGLAVVQLLEAAQQSLDNHGQPVSIS